jgi:hypothetical protein
MQIGIALIIIFLLFAILTELRDTKKRMTAALFDVRYLLAGEDPSKYGGTDFPKIKSAREWNESLHRKNDAQ